VAGHDTDFWPLRKARVIRHCEEQGDEAISNWLILNNEIAALRPQ
jgi:hypothetical protein